MGEPADAQAIYKMLDPVMLAVLTDPNANITQLLSTAPARSTRSWPTPVAA